MATPQSTTSGDAPKGNLEQITFRFCSECSNMLYPKEDEDNHKLMFTCRTCLYTEEATSSCVFRHVLNNAVGETAGVTQDVASDPTVCGPVSSHPDARDVVAAAAVTTASAVTAASEALTTTSTDDNNTLALCLRCGFTLLHCDRCNEPASVDEYNNYVLQDPNFAVERCLRYIQLANSCAVDEATQAVFERRFSTFNGLVIPRSSEETIAQYLPFEWALDPEADPPEALGVEPSAYDLISTLD